MGHFIYRERRKQNQNLLSIFLDFPNFTDTQNSQPNTIVKAVVIVGISLVLGLLFDYFFYGKIPGIAFPLYIILVVAGLFTIAKIFKQKISKEVLLLLAPLTFFSVMVFVRSSDSLISSADLILLKNAPKPSSKVIHKHIGMNMLFCMV
jgi:hypothetical protein